MKKALKITGIIIGVLVIAALIIIVFFPGLPTYIKVKKDCPRIDETMGIYKDSTDTVPEDFVQVELKGILISGPADALRTDGSFVAFKKENELAVMVIESENEPLSYEGSNFSIHDHRHFFSSLDVKAPESNYESMEFVRNLTAKDCLKLRGTDKKVFEEYAEIKETVSDIETIYYYERDGLSGFVCELIGVGQAYEHRKNVVLLEGDKQWIITVFGNDAETVDQIISSIKISE